MTLTYSGVEDVRGGFSVRDVTLSGFTRFSCASMTLRPDLLASLALLAPVCEVAFSRGSLTMGQPMAFATSRSAGVRRASRRWRMSSGSCG